MVTILEVMFSSLQGKLKRLLTYLLHEDLFNAIAVRMNGAARRT
jgi:hypothetical protein